MITDMTIVGSKENLASRGLFSLSEGGEDCATPPALTGGEDDQEDGLHLVRLRRNVIGTETAVTTLGKPTIRTPTSQAKARDTPNRASTLGLRGSRPAPRHRP